MDWNNLLRELGYPATSVAILIIGGYFFRWFFQSFLTTVINKDLEVVRQANAKELEELRRWNSAQLQEELEDLRSRNAEQLEAIKRDYTIAIEDRKATLIGAANELTYVREHYAAIKEYSSMQAEALRRAYLALFEPSESDHLNDDAVESVIENLLTPLRRHLGIVDEFTARKVYAVANFLRYFKGRESELKGKKISFWEITEAAKRFVKADRIAYRLGLINRILKGVQMVKVKVLKDGIPLLSNYTYPQIGVEVPISEDEWASDEVQRFVRDGMLEKIQLSDDQLK